MSGKVMGLVFDCELDPTMKYVLLAFADNADHDGGSIHPGIELIAWKTGLTVRAIHSNIRKLEAMGLLERTNPHVVGRGHRAEYRIPIENMPIRDRKKGAPHTPITAGPARIERVHDLHRSEIERVNLATEKGESRDRKTEGHLLKEPSIEPSKETHLKVSKESRAKKIDPGWIPSEEERAWAMEERGLSARKVAEEADRMRDHFLANGKPMKDWAAVWRNWIRRAPEFSNGRGGAPQPGGGLESAHEYLANRGGRGLR